MSLFKKKPKMQASVGAEGESVLTGADIAKIVSDVIDEKVKKQKKFWEQERRELYLLPEDIQELTAEFTELEEEVRALEGEVSDSYLELLCQIIESAIKTRIKDISRQRETERIKEIETAAARDYEQTPRYYRPWRRLFRLTPNRAMSLIIEREEQTARLIHLHQQIENDVLRRQADEELNAYLNGEPVPAEILETVSEESEAMEPQAEPSEEAKTPEPEEVIAELPKRKKRKKKSEATQEEAPAPEEVQAEPSEEKKADEAGEAPQKIEEKVDNDKEGDDSEIST